MDNTKFKGTSPELVDSLRLALESSCKQLDFDLRCLDWFSYTPDFFIEQRNKKVA